MNTIDGDQCGATGEPAEVTALGAPDPGDASDTLFPAQPVSLGHLETEVTPQRNKVTDEGKVLNNIAMLRQIFDAVVLTGKYNFAQARLPIPSELNIPAWRDALRFYADRAIVDYLAFGWPINFDRASLLFSTPHNHPSADRYADHVDHYVQVEMQHGALARPFAGPPVEGLQLSPLMTRPKKDSRYRRVIIDLSWPKGAAVNDGVDPSWYIDGPATITLPTADYMADRLLQLGKGAFLYKTDLARGYRQLRVDPHDWPLLGFQHRGAYFMDICPPFGLRSSAMCMQRTAEAIVYIHGLRGYYSRAYLDDFGGAEATEGGAHNALTTLQAVMTSLGVVEAKHKVHQPAQAMVWLGIHYDSRTMEMCIPAAKMEEVMAILLEWEGRTRATRRDLQRLLGLLQFVASVAPTVRAFSNRMLQNLRDTPHRGSHGLSLGFRKDLKFFLDLLPHFNGVRIIDKEELSYQGEIELDACLTGCGATVGEQYYAEVFPPNVLAASHIIAHLELLNIVVALKVWGPVWRGYRVKVLCDNTNACFALQTGRSKDSFIQHCIREVFLFSARHDVELVAVHRAGELLVRADALSRMHSSESHRRWTLMFMQRVAPPQSETAANVTN